MIYYDTKSFFRILLQRTGSPLRWNVIKRALIMAIICCGVVFLHKKHHIFDGFNSTTVKDTLTVSNVFLGLLISFRLNSAFTQWRAGVQTIGLLTEAARTLVATTCTYLDIDAHDKRGKGAGSDNSDSERAEISEAVASKCNVLIRLRRLVLLYIAIVFHHCREIDSIEDLTQTNLLTDSELDEFEASGTETSSRHNQSKTEKANKLRATLVELWIRRIIQQLGNQGDILVPHATQLNALVSQMSQLYHKVCSIAHIPIPFCYVQFLEIAIVMYITLYSLITVPISGFYAPLWVFGWSLILFLADDVATEIECPFGTDANDIDLELRMLNIEEQLTSILKSKYHASGIPTEKLVRIKARSSSTPSSSRNYRLNLFWKTHGNDSQASLPEVSTSVTSFDEYTPLIVGRTHDRPPKSSSESAVTLVA